jgi:hypothetical protein
LTATDIVNAIPYSYPEKQRDWPDEASATGRNDTVLIPAGGCHLIDETFADYLSVQHILLGVLFLLTKYLD